MKTCELATGLIIIVFLFTAFRAGIDVEKSKHLSNSNVAIECKNTD